MAKDEWTSWGTIGGWPIRSEHIWMLGITGGFVLLIIIILFASSDGSDEGIPEDAAIEESTVTTESTDSRGAEDTLFPGHNERAIKMLAGGIARLSLRYGIVIDEMMLREMLRDDTGGPLMDADEGDRFAVWVSDIFYDDDDLADELEKSIREDGDDPREVMQSFADRVERFRQSKLNSS